MVRLHRILASTPILALPQQAKALCRQSGMLDFVRSRGRHCGMLAQYEETRFHGGPSIVRDPV